MLVVNESHLLKLIEDELSDYPEVKFGIADTSYTEYSAKYKSAMVLAVPHKEIMTSSSYSEEKLEELICSAREEANLILSGLAKLFESHAIDYFIPPMAQRDEESLVAQLSFKYAAVNAGIGWIGKSGLLITKEYGPRVRLSVVLLGSALPAGTPILHSHCKEECSICAASCLYNALTGIQWNAGKKREELIDFRLCNTKRSQYLTEHGRKNACGLCLVSCPIGAE